MEVVIKLVDAGNLVAASIKQFPNGFTNWMETHHEVVAFITTQVNIAYSDTEISRIQESQGSCGLYTLAEQWTDEFETLHEGREWDGEFFDEIEKVCNEKNIAS